LSRIWDFSHKWIIFQFLSQITLLWNSDWHFLVNSIQSSAKQNNFFHPHKKPTPAIKTLLYLIQILNLFFLQKINLENPLKSLKLAIPKTLISSRIFNTVRTRLNPWLGSGFFLRTRTKKLIRGGQREFKGELRVSEEKRRIITLKQKHVLRGKGV
jgi:hypothetical protein